ncbi:MAG: roadblock/LC7 domain-containing protein [Chloroherpetonaceae bacterium]|nr:roadblock/LC7 domain-containing protein [Chloroherpetonaceae bacterium]MDW8438314.1 roadblock/LC7 domain-containing protein [Chloroherpetonaceae bacterium]
MPINYSAIQSALQEFVTSVSNVQGASIMSPDGLAIASSLPAGMEEERVAAMSAAMLALGERIGRELSRGQIERILVEGEKGYAIVSSCTEDAVLIVLTDEKVKLGVINLEVRQLIDRLRPSLTFAKTNVA